MFLQSFGYASDPVRTLRAARAMLTDDGFILLTRTQPIRSPSPAERNGPSLGEEYSSRDVYSYRSSWNDQITLSKLPYTSRTVERLQCCRAVDRNHGRAATVRGRARRPLPAQAGVDGQVSSASSSSFARCPTPGAPKPNNRAAAPPGRLSHPANWSTLDK